MKELTGIDWSNLPAFTVLALLVVAVLYLLYKMFLAVQSMQITALQAGEKMGAAAILALQQTVTDTRTAYEQRIDSFRQAYEQKMDIFEARMKKQEQSNIDKDARIRELEAEVSHLKESNDEKDERIRKLERELQTKGRRAAPRKDGDGHHPSLVGADK